MKENPNSNPVNLNFPCQSCNDCYNDVVQDLKHRLNDFFFNVTLFCNF